MDYLAHTQNDYYYYSAMCVCVCLNEGIPELVQVVFHLMWS